MQICLKRNILRRLCKKSTKNIVFKWNPRYPSKMVFEEPVYKNTKVYYRFFPETFQPVENIKILEDRKTIYIRCLQDLAKGKQFLHPNYWKFECDGVFFNESQEKIFKEVVNDSIFDKILNGENAAIICFGQTCSGKTITASALENSYEDRGLIPRILQQLYNIKNDLRSKTNVKIKIKYVETSRNYINDLLSSDHVLYDMNSLNKISNVAPKKLQDALKVIFKAEARRTVKSAEFHNSNIANSVITIIVTAKSVVNNYYTVGKLCIVDLCGTDTVGNESCYHKSGFEVGTGNLAKSQLDQFALILNTKNKVQAKLTHRLSIIINYLDDILKSRSTLRFIGHLRLNKKDIRITLSMLRFGDCVRCLSPLKTSNEHFLQSPNEQTKALEAKLLVLKKERDFNCMLTNDNIGETLLSRERYEYIEKLALDYLQDKNGELVILNTTDAVLAMKVFKETFNKVAAERDNLKEDLRKQDELVRTSKYREATSSKQSKRSNASTTSLIKTKKSNGASVTKQNRRSSGHINKKDRDRDSLTSTLRSKRTSKQNSRIMNKKSSKRQSNESQIDIKRGSSALLEEPPVVIPTYEAAWEKFAQSEEYQRMQEGLNQIEEQSKELYATYLEGVKNVKKCVDVFNIRKEELFKVLLLKDLSETIMLDDANSKTDLELLCANNVTIAEKELVESKEALLKRQTDLNLSIQERNFLKKEIEKTFEEFCKHQFNTLIPMYPENIDHSGKNEINSQLYENELGKQGNEDKAEQAKEAALCNIITEYNKLRLYFMKELKKILKEKEKNQKWIQSCKLI